MNTKVIFASALSGFLLVSLLPTDADAATIRVKCEQRDGRSRVSVDGKDLAFGQYRCMVSSRFDTTTAPMNTFGDELECDFDSDPGNIAEGATPISPDFILGGQVLAKILTPEDHTVISDTVSCRVRDN